MIWTANLHKKPELEYRWIKIGENTAYRLLNRQNTDSMRGIRRKENAQEEHEQLLQSLVKGAQSALRTMPDAHFKCQILWQQIQENIFL